MPSFGSFGENEGFVQELFALYRVDPRLVGPDWAAYFAGLAHGDGQYLPERTNGNGHTEIQQLQPVTVPQPAVAGIELLQRYRTFGHLRAKLSPLGADVVPLPPRPVTEFDDPAAGLEARLDALYCGSVGFEFEHIRPLKEREFLRAAVEERFGVPTRGFSNSERRRFLEKLIHAERLEAELHRRYVGHKRFSGEGGETLIPMLDLLLDHAAGEGAREAIIGMAHRGRLAVLTQVIGKPLGEIIAEFEDEGLHSVVGAGDVKYHLGADAIFNGASENPIRVRVASNPSHLEFVNPVVAGMIRGREDSAYGRDRRSALPIIIHGDAAVAGQGVVYETLNFSRVRSCDTGGTIHVVINNRIGFTTNPVDSRSSFYCTDMARGIEIPVFHVNFEDIEAACWVMNLAFEYRQRFGGDVLIDLICFRKYGHNEGDDPSFTQPLVYEEVKKKQPVWRGYGEALVQAGVLSAEDLEGISAEYARRFEDAVQSRKRLIAAGEPCPLRGRLRSPDPATHCDDARILAVADSLTAYPPGFVPHPKLAGILEKRVAAVHQGDAIEWGVAEALAYGTLLQDGVGVRLHGQDCQRGTFSHRHLVLTDFERQTEWSPLSRFESEGVRCEIYNSTLSEAAVLGFEFGFAVESPRTLVIWEAQFGDFVNGGQVAIDQFLAASEAKWGQLCGLTLMLPHGFEGQGPEHSSARLERFLQLCAEGNMTVCVPSTAAQHFHLLRRQGRLDIKRPLIIFTPKSLLRSPDAACRRDVLSNGGFQRVISEKLGDGEPEAVVLCSGKVAYDVRAGLTKAGRSARLLRIEELYPFPEFDVRAAVERAPEAKLFWVQEEPENMGAWNYVNTSILKAFGTKLRFVGRAASASPATGSLRRHLAEQQKIVADLLEKMG